MSKTSFTIGQLAKMADVNIQTIRFYERQGILKQMLGRTQAIAFTQKKVSKSFYSFVRQSSWALA